MGSGQISDGRVEQKRTVAGTPKVIVPFAPGRISIGVQLVGSSSEYLFRIELQTSEEPTAAARVT